MTKEKREKKEVSSDGLLLRGEHMEISMNSLLYSFLWSIVLGAFLGVAYDVVRISRAFIGVEYGNIPPPPKKIKLPIISKLKKEKKCNKRRASSVALNIFIFAGDILFCVFTALALVIYIYHSNEGKARWMVFFGAAIGFFAYYFSIGKLVVLFSQYIPQDGVVHLTDVFQLRPQAGNLRIQRRRITACHQGREQCRRLTAFPQFAVGYVAAHPVADPPIGGGKILRHLFCTVAVSDAMGFLDVLQHTQHTVGLCVEIAVRPHAQRRHRR